MKTIKNLFLIGTASLLLGASAQAQSFGFTLGNGASFAYSHGGGSIGLSSGGGRRCGGGYANPYGPIYYAPAPAYYTQRQVVYPQNAVIVRTTPYTYNTSYQISYPNRW